MAEDRRATGYLTRATALVSGTARALRDRKLQQALLELAGMCDAFDRSPSRGTADADRLAAKAKVLAKTARVLGAAEFVVTS